MANRVMSPSSPVGPGGVEALYRALSGRLEQIVRLDVDAPEVVIEDACQFAWTRLVVHSRRVRHEAALSWLAATAVHEAFKLIRRDRRELSLEAVLDQLGDRAFAETAAGPHELVERRERLAVTAQLPGRQRRFMWLHAVGLNYAEIAQVSGCTRRTVERQLLRAKRTARAVAAA